MGTMHGNAMRLLKLINDLLELVRLESGRAQVRYQRVDIEGLHQRHRHRGRLRGQGQAHPPAHLMSLRKLGTVMADPEKLERICLNLLFNALKFTAAGGRVDFNAEQTEGDWLSSKCVTPAWASRRISSRTSSTFLAGGHLLAAQVPGHGHRSGPGEGTRRIAGWQRFRQQRGGQVGTTMTVKLPLLVTRLPTPRKMPADETGCRRGALEREAEKDWIADLYRRAELFPAMTSLQATLRPVETSIGRSRKPMLLIADDEPDMLRFLKGQLSANFEVLEAVDGQQAVDKAAQFLPDIILSDMMMPEKDGLQVCRELRERTSTRSIPVVLLTARADEKTKLDCLAAGASDFLPKPFSLTEDAWCA
jgi:CheY-like chemotaxis protein